MIEQVANQSSARVAVSASLASGSTNSVSPEERLLALIVFSQAKQADGAEATITLSQQRLEGLRQEAAEALQRAQEAQKDAGFWGEIAEFLGSDIGQIAALVAAAAAVVATAGAGTAIVAAVAAAASVAAQHAEELGIPPEVAMVIAVVAAVASLCVGNGGALFELSSEVRLAAANVQQIAVCVEGAATAGAGGAGIVEGKHDSDARHAQADARSADGLGKLESAAIDDAIQRLARALDQQLKALDQGSQMIQRDNRATTSVLFTLGGVA